MLVNTNILSKIKPKYEQINKFTAIIKKKYIM